MIMLDTNICIYLIKRKPPSVLRHFQNYRPGDIAISAITLAELEYGVAKSHAKERNKKALSQFIIPLEVLPFDQAATASYGQIRAELEKQGKPIGANDLLIAAHALSLDALLVTNNLKEFARIEDLKLANWVE
jgi:tRNA(fMet)-specific endonuclease VapC